MKIKKDTNYKKFLGIWGIVLSLIGTFYLAISAFEYDGSYVETIDHSKKFHPLFLDSILFKLSLWVIGLGSIMQLAEKIWDEIPRKYYLISFSILYWFSVLVVIYMAIYKILGIF